MGLKASEGNRVNLLGRAARAYIQAGNPAKAARCYEDAEDWSRACQLYRKSSHFDEAIRLLRSHAPPKLAWLRGSADIGDISGGIDPKEANLALHTSRMYLVKNSNLQRMRGLFENTEGKSLPYIATDILT